MTSAIPVVTTGRTPPRSIQRPAGRATRMPAAPGIPISPAATGPRPCTAAIISASVAQKPP